MIQFSTTIGYVVSSEKSSSGRTMGWPSKAKAWRRPRIVEMVRKVSLQMNLSIPLLANRSMLLTINQEYVSFLIFIP